MKLEQDEPVTIVLTSEGVGIDDLVQNWNTNMIAVLSAPSVTSSCQVRVLGVSVFGTSDRSTKWQSSHSTHHNSNPTLLCRLTVSSKGNQNATLRANW